MINIKESTEKISNCNVCGAINFDSELSFNEKVDTLTEIWVGRNAGARITLCDNCLKELSDKITNYIESKSNTVKHHAEIISTKEVVEIYQFYQNGIGYIGDNGIKIVFNGDYRQID